MNNALINLCIEKTIYRKQFIQINKVNCSTSEGDEFKNEVKDDVVRDPDESDDGLSVSENIIHQLYVKPQHYAHSYKICARATSY